MLLWKVDLFVRFTASWPISKLSECNSMPAGADHSHAGIGPNRQHQQNYKNLFGLLALLGTFSIVGKTERGNKSYKFDKLTDTHTVSISMKISTNI